MWAAHTQWHTQRTINRNSIVLSLALKTQLNLEYRQKFSCFSHFLLFLFFSIFNHNRRERKKYPQNESIGQVHIANQLNAFFVEIEPEKSWTFSIYYVQFEFASLNSFHTYQSNSFSVLFSTFWMFRAISNTVWIDSMCSEKNSYKWLVSTRKN